jgi:AraC-like DNA-binding protein
MTGGAIQHVRFETSEPDLGYRHIREVYLDHEVTLRDPDRNFRLSVDHLRIGPVFVSWVRQSMAGAVRTRDGLGWQAIFTNRRGVAEVQTRHQVHRIGAGGSFAFRPDAPYSFSWESLDVEGVGLDYALLADQVAQHLETEKPFRFDFDEAISAAAAEHWHRTVEFARRVGLANAANSDGTLLAHELSLLLTGTALMCFPNPTLDGDAPARAGAAPASLRRAVAYIDANLDQSVTLTDIAAAARVSPRALRETFRRHLDTTPMAYVRRGRMASAHAELQAAEPGDGQTVTSIASHWGFAQLPRFGVLYRKAYGTPPSQTLRRARTPSDSQRSRTAIFRSP